MPPCLGTISRRMEDVVVKLHAFTACKRDGGERLGSRSRWLPPRGELRHPFGTRRCSDSLQAELSRVWIPARINTTPTPALGAHLASYSFPGRERPECEDGHLSPSSVEVKKEWSYTSISLICLYGVDRDNAVTAEVVETWWASRKIPVPALNRIPTFRPVILYVFTELS